jgi:hypothetical protein
VGKHQKLLWKILGGRADSNISFADLRSLLIGLGFEERVGVGHHVFRRQGISELINIQRDGSKAKPYQVEQVRSVILKYRLGELHDE